MAEYQILLTKLAEKPRKWLVTGCAGFIGSNLVETLLQAGQQVFGLDNFSTGHRSNLEHVRRTAGEKLWTNFHFTEGDIRSLETCRQACAQADFILHQAALGSVPRSIENPIVYNENNISGFLNMLTAARESGTQGFVYASSSSVYGDEPDLPKRENRLGRPLSPYALGKYVNELYAQVFSNTYAFNSIGLRYFNIFGKRQDPNGAYAAVIPKWFSGLLRGEQVYINGDGQTSRDFCFIENCIQANLLAATSMNPTAWNQVYNIAVGERITLNALFELIRQEVLRFNPEAKNACPEYRDFRVGDVRHSLADISLAQSLLGYAPEYTLPAGLHRAAEWYAQAL